MSKTLSFRGSLAMGLQDKIHLKTIKGKIGYKITKFQVINYTALDANVALVAKIYSKDQTNNISDKVDFSEGDLLGVATYKSSSAVNYSTDTTIIFDNQVFNQNIFIYIQDAVGGTDVGNYYIELETMELSDVQATQLTLKNLRTIASR